MSAKLMNLLLFSAKDAAKLLDICTSTFWKFHNNGRLGPLPIRLGRRTLWSRKDLEAWTDAGCPARVQWLARKQSEAKVKMKQLVRTGT